MFTTGAIFYLKKKLFWESANIGPDDAKTYHLIEDLEVCKYVLINIIKWYNCMDQPKNFLTGLYVHCITNY